MNDLLKGMSIKELLVIYLRYHKGETLRDIAKECDAPIHHIHRIHNSARAKLTKGVEELIKNNEGDIKFKLLYWKHLIPTAYVRKLKE